ncbi:hypothetical protein [Bradyrhizobium sp. USDA 3256]
MTLNVAIASAKACSAAVGNAAGAGVAAGAVAVGFAAGGTAVCGAGTGGSASGSLPFTDCTKAIVCAIRRSRSFIHFMAHPERADSSKATARNQALAIMMVDEDACLVGAVT